MLPDIGEQNSQHNHWVIAMITLGFYIILVSCSLLPPGSNDSKSSPTTIKSIIPSPTRTSTLTATTPPTPAQTFTPSPTTVPGPPLTEDPGTVESTPIPFVPIQGAADKITFVEGDDIWMVNLDGSQLTRLTSDGTPKKNPRWTFVADELVYISGLCAKAVNIQTLIESNLACFEDAERLDAFEISPDGQQAAISLDRQLFIVPFDKPNLGRVKSSNDLVSLAGCEFLMPYRPANSLVTVSAALWSPQGDYLSILRQGFESDRQVDLIHILDVSTCSERIPRLDEFPATRFEMEGYANIPVIPSFSWNGSELFALTSFKRNDGFGDLWIYDSNLKRAFEANPVNGKCCYRDPVFSPDGKYIAFVFQDAQAGSNEPAFLYYIPFEALDTSLIYPPIPLPEDFFSKPRAKPQPDLRSAP